MITKFNLFENSGYVGYSMSVRAADAYDDGKLPKSKLKEKYKLSETDFNYLLENDMLESEWHHTSKFYNKTNFYKINISGLIFLKNNGNIQALEELKKNNSKKRL